MMTMAAYEGLRFCALEGFNQDKMTVLLGDEFRSFFLIQSILALL